MKILNCEESYISKWTLVDTIFFLLSFDTILHNYLFFLFSKNIKVNLLLRLFYPYTNYHSSNGVKQYFS